MNKYKKYYNAIVENARIQDRTCYIEKHHIVPRSLGGSDDTSNIVKLTAREHFICHWLLTKFTTGINKGKMIKALSLMRSETKYQKRYSTKITARVYENIKVEHAEIIRKQNTGWQPTKEQRQKISESKMGKTRDSLPDLWFKKMRERYKGEDNPMYGKTHSAESKRKMSESAKGRKAKRTVCEHCEKDVAINIYKQWHGDKCSENKANNPT